MFFLLDLAHDDALHCIPACHNLDGERPRSLQCGRSGGTERDLFLLCTPELVGQHVEISTNKVCIMSAEIQNAHANDRLGTGSSMREH